MIGKVGKPHIRCGTVGVRHPFYWIVAHNSCTTINFNKALKWCREMNG